MKSTLVAGMMLAAATAVAQASDGIDLTGTYEGTYTCAGTFNGEPFAETFEFRARVGQDGDHIRLSYPDQGGQVTIYEGLLDRVEPGGNFLTGILQTCGGDYDFEELMRIENGYEFEEEDGFTASFDGTSIFVTTGFPGSEGDFEIDSCVYAFNRVSTSERHVPECDFTPRILEILEPAE